MLDQPTSHFTLLMKRKGNKLEIWLFLAIFSPSLTQSLCAPFIIFSSFSLLCSSIILFFPLYLSLSLFFSLTFQLTFLPPSSWVSFCLSTFVSLRLPQFLSLTVHLQFSVHVVFPHSLPTCFLPSLQHLVSSCPSRCFTIFPSPHPCSCVSLSHSKRFHLLYYITKHLLVEIIRHVFRTPFMFTLFSFIFDRLF